MYGDHQDLHGLTHSFPTRRSSDLEPLRAFLLQHSSNAERAFFLRSAQRLLPPSQRGDITADHFLVVVPAFTVSELTAAFQIGFLIFLPFLVIDMVVANILLALGMMRSEEHTSELQSLMRISYAVFCLKKKITKQYDSHITNSTVTPA